MLLKGNPSMAKQVSTLPYTTTVNSGHYTKKNDFLKALRVNNKKKDSRKESKLGDR